MKKSKNLLVVASLSVGFLLSVSGNVCLGAGPRLLLDDHLPPALAKLRATDFLPATNELHFAISLPARNPEQLDALLKDIYSPGSARYHQYLTPARFAENFGATKADYQALIEFAAANGLRVIGTHPNRLVLDLTGSVAAIEKAFQVRIGIYQHPIEGRKFYAPDTTPSVDASLPLSGLSISGLDNYSLPHPASLHPISPGQPAGAIPNIGSGPGGTYMGKDFRQAYVPGNFPLTGAGQSVALLQFDGYYLSDINAYVTATGLPVVPANILTNIPVNGGVSTPGSGGIEVSLDIEMVICMATNLSKLYVYEGPNGSTPWVTILSQIANDNFAKQISCSWGGSANPNSAAEVIFKQMAAQGQSFFCASGDNNAYVGGATFPEDSPNITLVGGTTLTTTTGHNRVSETAWNAGLDQTTGKYIGTGGGISTIYPIPWWQQAISSFATNGGSTFARNVPDVALTADNIYVKYGNGLSTTVTGTSCAAPLWAGFMALVNQQAANSNMPPVGFMNPLVYEIANESVYSVCFNDITTGSNTWPSSPRSFYAVTNYDLCTGLGTPKSTNLINALAIPDPLVVITNIGFNAVGTPAGTFNVTSQTYTLTNIGSSSLAWSLFSTSTWLSVSSPSGTLPVGGSTTVTVGLNTIASNLMAGAYSAKVWFSNVTSHVGHSRAFTLQPSDPLVILPGNKFFFSGLPGGPFNPSAQVITLTNPSSGAFNWGINNTSAWLNVSPTSGSLTAGGQTNVTFTPTPAALNFPDGFYTANFRITNLTSSYVQLITANLAAGIIQNGGFELGDFTGWILVGNTNDGSSIYNAVVSATSLADNSGPSFIHSGTYGAFLGDTNPATLSQSFQTTPGQNYRLSFWLTNPTNGAGQTFSVNWNTNSPAMNQIYYITNPPVMSWSNFNFLVTATGTNTTLLFGAQNPPNGFGLDDVSVVALVPPVFTSQPTNLTVNAGANAAFSATANGVPPLAYQWRKDGTNLINGVNVSGATSNLLVLIAATVTNAGGYTLIVTNNYGAITSSVATLTVNLPAVPPGISNVTVNLNGSISLSLLGSPSFTYVLQSTTNLTSPAFWQPLATNIMDSTGVWLFTDSQATNYMQQFYRLMLQQ